MSGTNDQATFPLTRWSEIVAAGKGDTEEGRAALDRVLRRYYDVLLAHLWSKRLAEADAADYLQGFVVDKVLKAGLLARADPHRGRFRTFLLNALDHYVHNRWRGTQTRKRRPAGGLVALEELEGFDPPDDLEGGPALTDKAWAVATFRAATQAMETECRAKGRLDVYAIFAGRFIRPFLYDEPLLPYATLVRELKLQSPAQASNLFITGKRMFERVLREIVGDCEKDSTVIEQEIADLKSILLAAGAGAGLDSGKQSEGA